MQKTKQLKGSAVDEAQQVGPAERASVKEAGATGCCLCGCGSRRACCLCCCSILLVVALLVFIFWPRCITIAVGPQLRVAVTQSDDAAPEFALGTDISIRSDNYWSISLARMEVDALYRGNSIGVVELSEGLTVPSKDRATFPIDLKPGFEDPGQSTMDYQSDCVVPQTQQALVGAAEDDLTWPISLVVTVDIASGFPTITVTIPDIAVPCASADPVTIAIADASSAGESASEESECLVG